MKFNCELFYELMAKWTIDLTIRLDGLSLLKSFVPTCKIVWLGFSLIDGFMLSLIHRTLDTEKLFTHTCFTYTLTYLIILSPRITIFFFSEITDVLELLLFLTLRWLSFALRLVQLVQFSSVNSMTDSDCKIQSLVNTICSTDWPILVSFVSDWSIFLYYILFLSIITSPYNS